MAMSPLSFAWRLIKDQNVFMVSPCFKECTRKIVNELNGSLLHRISQNDSLWCLSAFSINVRQEPL